MNLITLATCSLNQWALDFSGNLERIVESIRTAKERGAVYRLGPELEIPGYGCQDHFLEGDTLQHSWEVLAEILDSDLSDGIICDIGLPVMHKNVRYNCRAIIYNREILLIRPKMILANDGNYRETRWFVPWQRPREVESFSLPAAIRQITGQDFVPFGDAAIDALDVTFAVEMCEELFAPGSPHTYLSLDGVEIIANGSGSHHQLRKLHRRIDLIQEATAKNGGVYLYANQQGCDGGRLYFDGSALIAVNGLIVEQGSQFSLQDVEVITATVDLDAVRSFRGAVASRMVQASLSPAVPRVSLPISLTHAPSTNMEPTEPQPVRYHIPEEEIAYGPACWLWDYLRRSGLSGFFLPLSGGSDSGAVAALVGSMCQLVVKEMRAGNLQVIDDVHRIVGEEFNGDATHLAHQLLHTAYLGTNNSSAETRARAEGLAEEIGAYHLTLRIDLVVDALIKVFVQATGKSPRFKTNGGGPAENVALQNIQARSRMVLAYLFAQLLPWVRGRSGGLLVLGTANVDEALRGYMTKYDNSSADINPIGGISKIDLRRFLAWAADNLGYPSLHELVTAVPTAELEPITDSYTQTDEEDMGMTYAELSIFGRLRKIRRCGPLEMYAILVHEWNHLTPREVADKVKRFFYYYSINRHKMTVLTPAYHAENYSPDDNRFDLRQFLYNARWGWQFRAIERRVVEAEGERQLAKGKKQQ